MVLALGFSSCSNLFGNNDDDDDDGDYKMADITGTWASTAYAGFELNEDGSGTTVIITLSGSDAASLTISSSSDGTLCLTDEDGTTYYQVAES